MRNMTKAALLCGSLLMASAVWGQASPSDFTSAVRYDAARRVTGTIAPDPDGGGGLRYLAVRNSYDAGGRLIKVEKGQLQDWQSQDVAPANWPGFTLLTRVETGYDVMNRKVVERAYEGASTSPLTVTQYSYNNQGLLECTVVRMNPGAFGSLPASACSLGTQGAQGPDRITRNEYDNAGQLLRVVRAYGTGLQQNYATYTYSPNGKRTSVKDANGNLAQMGYDGFDRQATWVFPSKTSVGQVDGGDYEAYGYDANGNRTSLRRRDGRTLSFGYDALNRVTSKVVADGCAPIQVGACAPSDTTRDVYYGYDLRGLQTYARFDGANGEGVTTAYDGFGAVTSSTTAVGGQSRTLSYQYDADGNRTRITHPDGVYFTQSYDGMDRIAGVGQSDGTIIAYTQWNALALPQALGKVGVNTIYGYDTIGRLTSQSQALASNAVTTTLGYNAASQIVSESRNNDAYAFNGRYNVSRSYGVNGQNQYTSAGPASFTYDANGNLVSDGSTSYLYDGENRLVSTSAGVSLRYDPLGRLWQVSGPSGTTRFLYDGDQLTAEYDANGTMLRRYVHGAGDDDPFVWYEGAGLGDRRSLMADHQGSVVAVADANGNPIRINAYDDYGIPKSDNLGRFQYTGQVYLPELGMYHYKARVYSPTLGRFLQTDPIGYDDEVNLYAYVANDPMNGRDPTGLQSIAEVEGAQSCAQNPSKCASDADITVNGLRNNLANIFSFGGISNPLQPSFWNFQWGMGGGSSANKICPKPGAAGNITNGIGLLFGAAAYIAGKISGTNPKIEKSVNGHRVTNSPINFGGRAVTLGNIEVFTTLQKPGDYQVSYTGAIVNNGRHEDGHTYQATTTKDAYLPAIVLSGILYGKKNPFEVGADEYGTGNCQ